MKDDLTDQKGMTACASVLPMTVCVLSPSVETRIGEAGPGRAWLAEWSRPGRLVSPPPPLPALSPVCSKGHRFAEHSAAGPQLRD